MVTVCDLADQNGIVAGPSGNYRDGLQETSGLLLIGHPCSCGGAIGKLHGWLIRKTVKPAADRLKAELRTFLTLERKIYGWNGEKKAHPN